MNTTTSVRMGAAAILVLGIAIGYVVSQTGIDVTETASAQTPAANEEGGAEYTTKDDPSLTPWNDPDDPYVFRLNKKDPSIFKWNQRNDKLDPNRKAGPMDLNRYKSGYAADAFPTFLQMPVALRPEDLKAGDIDVAIVGSCTDMNPVPGAMWAANMLRGFLPSSATYYQAKGDGKQTRERDVFPIDQYVRSSLHEINIADYGNIKRHGMSGEKSTEEVRAVLNEIYEGGAIPMVVGGSHDNMYGEFLAVADKYGKGNFGVLHLDSHIDAAPFGYGYYVHNGNGIYMGVEMGLFKGTDLVQVGITSIMNDEILAWLNKNGVRVHYQAEIEKDGWLAVMKRMLEEVKDIENLVVTIDIDVMNQIYVPGTGGRQPDGPSSEEMMRLMRALGIQNNVVLVEISEYNPMIDSSSNQTALVVRNLMEHYLYGLAARMRGIKDPLYYHPDMIYDGR